MRQLDSILEAAAEAVVCEVSGEVLIRAADPAGLAELRGALRVRRALDAVCACAGDYLVEFTGAGGERIATVGHHHGYSLRWEGVDAELDDGTALLRWLAERGVGWPLERFRAEEARRAADGAERAVAERSWRARAAVPPEVVDAVLGPRPPDDAELMAHVRAAHPQDTGAALALLAWCGAGTGRYSGFPAHEAIPGRLLAELPIATIVAALAAPEATDEHLAGAVRHLTDWRSRRKLARDIGRLPAPLRARLVAAGQRSPDPTVRSRAAEKLGGPPGDVTSAPPPAG